MQIDAATRRNLELTQSLSGSRKDTLLSVVDHTVTAGGGRLLERRLSSPSRDLGSIGARQDAVQQFVDGPESRDALRAALRRVPDLDRALSRLSLERGGPRDLAAIRNGLEQAEMIATMGLEISDLVQSSTRKLTGHDALIGLLSDALIAEPPLLARDGGFIASGFDTDLDEVRLLRDEGRSVVASLQKAYAEQTGISSLKIKHNNVLGYFIETTSTHADKMLAAPLSETFIHRQTTANQVRFTTVELSELETKILNAGHRALEIEKGHFQSLCRAILQSAAHVSETARALAELDLASSLAHLAHVEDWTRPIVDDSRSFHIERGRHPVVEQALKASGAPFIANTCDLTKARIWLLTGPNMAGKSTFLRQNALIAVLAQMGSFVPASHAHIGIVSQLFSRVGASDDLAKGRSTFMVEMAVKEWEGDVIFLHEVIKGAADRSYGVQVAKLAGLPSAVVERARIVLDALEKGERDGNGQKAVIDDLPLFSATPTPAPAKQKPNPAIDLLNEVHPDELTPKEALNLIYQLKEASQSD